MQLLREGDRARVIPPDEPSGAAEEQRKGREQGEREERKPGRQRDQRNEERKEVCESAKSRENSLVHAALDVTDAHGDRGVGSGCRAWWLSFSRHGAGDGAPDCVAHLKGRPFLAVCGEGAC